MKSNHPITSRKTTCSWKKSGGTMPSVTRHRNSRERGEKKFFFSILSCKTAFLWNQRLRQYRGSVAWHPKKKNTAADETNDKPILFCPFFSDFQLCHFEFVAISNRFVCRPWQNVPSTHYAKQVSTAASLSEQFYVHSNSAIDLLQY